MFAERDLDGRIPPWLAPGKIRQSAEEPCSVLVVGAGPSGLECARVLGERGYDVHLREAEDELGGHLNNVQKYPGLSEWGRVTSYREHQLSKLKNVEVHRGTGKMSADDILEYGADKVVLAVGARWDQNGVTGSSGGPLPGADATFAAVCNAGSGDGRKGHRSACAGA